jgi:hypothetical protein
VSSICTSLAIGSSSISNFGIEDRLWHSADMALCEMTAFAPEADIPQTASLLQRTSQT